MKVKELKEILKGMDEEEEINIENNNDTFQKEVIYKIIEKIEGIRDKETMIKVADGLQQFISVLMVVEELIHTKNELEDMYNE